MKKITRDKEEEGEEEEEKEDRFSCKLQPTRYIGYEEDILLLMIAEKQQKKYEYVYNK